MVEVDYDQLADFGGFDGHTPRLILFFSIEHPWGKPLRAFHLPDAVLKTVKEVEAEMLKIIESRPLAGAMVPSYCGMVDDHTRPSYFGCTPYGRLMYSGKP